MTISTTWIARMTALPPDTPRAVFHRDTSVLPEGFVNSPSVCGSQIYTAASNHAACDSYERIAPAAVRNKN
jgi:hypothetical protein